MVGTFEIQKEKLEYQIQSLKTQVELLSLVDPNFSLVSELEKLLVKDLEFKKLQEDINKAIQDLQEKDKFLEKSLPENESLRRQLEATKNRLVEAKHLIWDNLIREVKKLKYYLVELEDERELDTTCLVNVTTIQESLGDKPLQALNAINYLDRRTQAQLTFAGIQDRLEIISQDRKYVIKDFMIKDIIVKDKFMLGG